MIPLLLLACSSPSSPSLPFPGGEISPPPLSEDSGDLEDSGKDSGKDSGSLEKEDSGVEDSGTPEDSETPPCSGDVTFSPNRFHVSSSEVDTRIPVVLSGCLFSLSIPNNFATTSDGTYGGFWEGLPPSLDGEVEVTLHFIGPGMFADLELWYSLPGNTGVDFILEVR